MPSFLRAKNLNIPPLLCNHGEPFKSPSGVYSLQLCDLTKPKFFFFINFLKPQTFQTLKCNLVRGSALSDIRMSDRKPKQP